MYDGWQMFFACMTGMASCFFVRFQHDEPLNLFMYLMIFVFGSGAWPFIWAGLFILAMTQVSF